MLSEVAAAQAVFEGRRKRISLTEPSSETPPGEDCGLRFSGWQSKSQTVLLEASRLRLLYCAVKISEA